MKAFVKILTAALVTAAFGCSEQGPKEDPAELWFYSTSAEDPQRTDSTRHLRKHNDRDSLIGEGNFLEGGVTHMVKAYTNDCTCGPHSCAVFVELDTIGCFYRRSLEGWAAQIWHSNSDSLNRLFELALERARTDSFLINKRYGFYLRVISDSMDLGGHIFSPFEVDSIPAYPSGQDSLTAFMNRALAYPDSERNASIQGKQFVSFVVETDGRITHLAIHRAITTALDSASIRAVRSMPAWTPARINTKAVPCQMVLPIEWKLREKGRT